MMNVWQFGVCLLQFIFVSGQRNGYNSMSEGYDVNALRKFYENMINNAGDNQVGNSYDYVPKNYPAMPSYEFDPSIYNVQPNMEYPETYTGTENGEYEETYAGIGINDNAEESNYGGNGNNDYAEYTGTGSDNVKYKDYNPGASSEGMTAAISSGTYPFAVDLDALYENQ